MGPASGEEITVTLGAFRRHHRLWWGLALATAAAVCLGWLAWYFVLQPIRVHREWSDRVRADLGLLVERRPAEVPPGQWEFLVGWTLNLHANCGTSHTTISDQDHARRFAEALGERLKQPVDGATIDWIWDEYEQFTTGGRHYSEKYRPSRSPDLQYAQPGCFGIHVR